MIVVDLPHTPSVQYTSASNGKSTGVNSFLSKRLPNAVYASAVKKLESPKLRVSNAAF
jgi:hypothetical protein